MMSLTRTLGVGGRPLIAGFYKKKQKKWVVEPHSLLASHSSQQDTHPQRLTHLLGNLFSLSSGDDREVILTHLRSHFRLNLPLHRVREKFERFNYLLQLSGICHSDWSTSVVKYCWVLTLYNSASKLSLVSLLGLFVLT